MGDSNSGMNQSTVILLAVLGGGAVGTGGGSLLGNQPDTADFVKRSDLDSAIAAAATERENIYKEVREVYLELKIDSTMSELAYLDSIERSPEEERRHGLLVAMLTDMKLKLQGLQR